MPVFPGVPARVVAALVAVAALGACGGGGDAGPTDTPAAVVARAPDVTFAAGDAHVVGAAPGVTAIGRVDFIDARAALKVRGPKKDSPPFGVRQPLAMIDLLRGVVHVRAYGGAEVQGEGTKRYEVDIDLSQAIAATPDGPRRVALHALDDRLGADDQVWGDVFVDRYERVRRVLLPVHTETDRPYGQSQIIPPMVSVDYSDFGSNA